jgi:quercetin dioxygenase-like cupin family protein
MEGLGMETNVQFLKLSEIETKDLIAKAEVRMVHTERMTVAYWDFEPEGTVHEHAHPHEQVSNVLEGVFDMVVDGKPYRLEPGVVLVIPPHATHGGTAVTACKIVDIFSPVREDYQ